MGRGARGFAIFRSPLWLKVFGDKACCIGDQAQQVRHLSKSVEPESEYRYPYCTIKVSFCVSEKLPLLTTT
jgi:hypothetical protein